MPILLPEAIVRAVRLIIIGGAYSIASGFHERYSRGDRPLIHLKPYGDFENLNVAEKTDDNPTKHQWVTFRSGQFFEISISQQDQS